MISNKVLSRNPSEETEENKRKRIASNPADIQRRYIPNTSLTVVCDQKIDVTQETVVIFSTPGATRVSCLV